MFAYIRAICATVLIFEISGAFALGVATLILLALHVSGIAFWSVEALTLAGVCYVCALFFSRALSYELSEATAED
ncbi:MAG: hypothetical protein WA989_10550 [Henriciella sp.]|uniref:hypothetical protein n=1 Tax=Henriciella sp. TaxID=1968823 RepID=UPI003C78C244